MLGAKLGCCGNGLNSLRSARLELSFLTTVICSLYGCLWGPFGASLGRHTAKNSPPEPGPSLWAVTAPKHAVF